MGTTYAVDEPPALHLADLATIGRVGVEGYGKLGFCKTRDCWSRV
jgi:hypothetical protein